MLLIDELQTCLACGYLESLKVKKAWKVVSLQGDKKDAVFEVFF